MEKSENAKIGFGSLYQLNKIIGLIIFILFIIAINSLIAGDKVELKFFKVDNTTNDIGIDLFLHFNQKQYIKNNNIKFCITITNKNNHPIKIFNPIYFLKILILNREGKQVDYQGPNPFKINSIIQNINPLGKKGYKVIKVESDQTIIKKENYFKKDFIISPKGKYIYTIRILKFRDVKKTIMTKADIKPGLYTISGTCSLVPQNKNDFKSYMLKTRYTDFVIK